MPIRPVEIMEKHTYDPDKDGIIALAQLVAEVCNNTDTDTKVAAEAAARIVDVDAEEADRIADVNAEETARINALNTHTGLPAAHHAKTIDASELTAGILALARLSGITNTQIAAGAAIAYTKLALAGLIRNTDIKSDAAIAESKLALAQGTQALFDKIAADILTHKNLAAAHHAKTVIGDLSPIALADLDTLVCSETEADGKISDHAGLPNAHHNEAHDPDVHATIASETLQHSNDATKGTVGAAYTKIKEMKLNAGLSACRLKFDMTCDGGDQTKSEDFTNWAKDDLIQIYGYYNPGVFTAYAKVYKNGVAVGTEQSCAASVAGVCEVKNMRIYYDLVTTKTAPTNQDP